MELPCIPHIRLYCNEMYYYTEQYKSKVEKSKHKNIIPVAHCVKISDTLEFLKNFQKSEYDFKPVVLQQLQDFELLKCLTSIPEIKEEKLEELTYSITPRLTIT